MMMVENGNCIMNSVCFTVSIDDVFIDVYMEAFIDSKVVCSVNETEKLEQKYHVSLLCKCIYCR